jgi:hypothetical protein
MFIMCHASISLCSRKLINYAFKCILAFVTRRATFYCHPCTYATYMGANSLDTIGKMLSIVWGI